VSIRKSYDSRRGVVTGMVSVAMLAVAATMTVEAAGAAGRLDRTFGDAGVVFVGDNGNACSRANETALQADGKLVSAISCPERLVRYQIDGSVDTSFGGNGGIAAPEKALAIQPDGKILSVDEVSVGFPRFAFRVQRFYADGTLDTGFGDAGTAIAQFDPVLEPVTRQGYDVSASDVVVQNDGAIVVAGTYNYYYYDGFTYVRRPVAQALARFTANGELDPAFGTQGKVVQDTHAEADPMVNPRESAQSLQLQADGKLVVAGYLENDNLDLMVTRYDIDGTPDSTFGADGVAVMDLGGDEFGRDLAIQADGKMVVAGRRELQGFSTADIALIRLQGDGSADMGFGAAGAVITDYDGFADSANGVAIQADGRIVAGGFVTSAGNQGAADTVIGLVRYGSDGLLDDTFGRHGIVATSVDSVDGESIEHVLIQPDGRIVASGSVITRYLP
jgi:uncharacterized delta-60 repeat protein